MTLHPWYPSGYVDAQRPGLQTPARPLIPMESAGAIGWACYPTKMSMAWQRFQMVRFAAGFCLPTPCSPDQPRFGFETLKQNSMTDHFAL
jgi:hypothetical protein